MRYTDSHRGLLSGTCHKPPRIARSFVHLAYSYMSVVELRVELPSYSHSFIIQVPISFTILEVKREISRTCTGAPRVDGQRIICRGRVLQDEERVEDLWKVSPNGYSVSDWC
jgi:hypothetical protein